MDQTIFKAYDIRGIYPDQINEDLAYKLGRAFVVFTQAKKVMVARDMRLSSESLNQSLIKGILDQGADIIDIGLSASPVFLFANAKYKQDAGIYITASHNPKEYNGFKLVRDKNSVMPITQDTGLLDIADIMRKNEFKAVIKKGGISYKTIIDEFIESIFKYVTPQEISNLRIVVDTGNGMAGMVFPKIFDKLSCQVTPLYWEIDGSFPNHQSNPLLAETTIDLKKRLIAEKADLGIATDGDADRIIFIDEKGQMIQPDLITALIAKELLIQNPRQKILYDTRSSRIVKETIEANGGQPVLCKSGYSFIKLKMDKEQILFGGERSGHYFLKDLCYRDVPFITALFILKILTREKKPISEIIQPFKKYLSIEETNFEVKNKDEIIKKVEKYYTQGKINHLDGITVEFKDWWFNLRPSNTESLLRLNLEANADKLMKEKFKEIKDLIK